MYAQHSSYSSFSFVYHATVEHGILIRRPSDCNTKTNYILITIFLQTLTALKLRNKKIRLIVFKAKIILHYIEIFSSDLTESTVLLLERINGEYCKKK